MNKDFMLARSPVVRDRSSKAVLVWEQLHNVPPDLLLVLCYEIVSQSMVRAHLITKHDVGSLTPKFLYIDLYVPAIRNEEIRYREGEQSESLD